MALFTYPVLSVAAALRGKFAAPMPGTKSKGDGQRYGPSKGRGGGLQVRVEASDLIKKLDGLEKYTARRVLHAASKYAAQLIDARTRDLYLRAKWESQPRSKGFRKRIRKKGAFKYTTKQTRGLLKFTSGFNYKYPEMRLGYLLEMGHRVGGTANKTSPMLLRHKAYGMRIKRARKAFIRAFNIALPMAMKDPKGRVSEKTIKAKLGDPWR